MDVIWVTIPNQLHLSKAVFIAGLALYVTIIGIGFVTAVRSTNWSSLVSVVCTMWLSSTIPMVATGMWIEHRTVSDILSVKYASWMFLFGDSICLPLAGLALAIVWRRHAEAPFGHQAWWIVISGLVGLLAGLAFHLIDKSNYTALAYNSPTKLVHDFCAYPLLFGGLVFVGLPVIFGGLRVYHGFNVVLLAIALIIGVGGWAGLGVIRGEFTGSLNVGKLHPQWHWTS